MWPAIKETTDAKLRGQRASSIRLITVRAISLIAEKIVEEIPEDIKKVLDELQPFYSMYLRDAGDFSGRVLLIHRSSKQGNVKYCIKDCTPRGEHSVYPAMYLKL